MNIQTVKYVAKIDAPTEHTGFLVNGEHNIPLVVGNRLYQAVEAWVAAGGVIEVAFSTDALLAQTKETKRIEINTLCGAEIVEGFSSSALGASYKYQSEETDQLNLIGVVAGGINNSFKCGVLNANNVMVWSYKMHTAAQLKQVLNDSNGVKQTLLQKANTLKAQITPATTLADVDAVAW